MGTGRVDAVAVEGPGGDVCAHAAAPLGLRVAVVEADRPGRIFLSWGCWGPPRPPDRRAVPSCAYCPPQVASWGLTEAEARRPGGGPCGYGTAQPLPEPAGSVRVVAAEDARESPGVPVVGAEATELIAGPGRALEVTMGEVAPTVPAHPTLAEAVTEAARDALRQAIRL